VKLGPRLIPHFRELVQESVSIVREAREGKDCMSLSLSFFFLLIYVNNLSQDSASTAENAIGVLSGLLVSIPTFWGKAEIVQVIKLYVDGHVDTLQASLGGLVKSMTKRLAPKSLLTTMCDAWTTLQIAGSDVRLFIIA
jgi:U3 small nucleolar RNA-associated protein 10